MSAQQPCGDRGFQRSLDTYSLARYSLDGGAKGASADLRGLIEPALKSKRPPNRRESYSFRVREDVPVTLDPRGRIGLAAML